MIHHYETDDRGIVNKVNLIVATQHNAAPICMSVKKAVQGLIKGGKVKAGLLNRVEMAFRAYDPCLSCVPPCPFGGNGSGLKYSGCGWKGNPDGQKVIRLKGCRHLKALFNQPK